MKKAIIFLLATLTLVFTLTGCGRSDIGITLNKNGTGSVAASFGIEKTVYEQFKSMGADIFEGKNTVEQKYGDATYVTYSEVNEYSSYEDIKAALLELTYNTEKFEELEEDNTASVSDSLDYTQKTLDGENKDDRIFSSVDIDRSSGMFYSVYTFRATINPPESNEESSSLGGNYKVTITVNMPDKITQSKGGSTKGKTIVFDFDDLTGPTEIVAVSEANHYGVVLGICGGLIIVVTVLFIVIRKKK